MASARQLLLSGYVEADRGHDTPCWEWTGPRTPNGYGLIEIGQCRLRVHRVAYGTFVGKIPAGHVVRHLCHNRVCYNPAHLATGTQSQNNIDARDAGRAVYGNPPVPAEHVALALYLHDMGWEDSDIARELTRVRGAATSDGSIRDWRSGRKRKTIYEWWRGSDAHHAVPDPALPARPSHRPRHRDDRTQPGQG